MSLTVQELAAFRTFVSERLGLAFDQGKSAFLSEVVERRMTACGCAHLSLYLGRIDGWRNGKELGALATALTIGETFFFRNADHFRALTGEVVPRRMEARSTERTLRLLSAGCASGEEAYSLAMTLKEHAPELADWQVRIDAIDVNPAALQKATRARYSTWALRETPDALQTKYFRSHADGFALDARVVAAVSFEEKNLVEDATWLPGYYDAIFCRNVIMYFTPAVAARVVANIERALVPGGFLFLGDAETLRGISPDFHLRHTHDTFYYQRRTEPSPVFVAAPLVPLAPIVRAAPMVVAEASEKPPSAWLPAFALLQEDRLSEAIAALNALPAEAIAHPHAQLLLAALLTNSGALIEAETVCARLLLGDELNAGAHYLTALCREGAGDRTGAVEHYRFAIYLDAAFAMPHLHLGLIAKRAGEKSSARHALAQALLLLGHENAERIVLFGGGFSRQGLTALCLNELEQCGDD